LLGDAIRRAADAFTDEEPDHKVIVVFSDGEDHGSYPLEAAKNLKESRSIPVYTVGIGDARQGAPIPVEVDRRRTYLTYQGEQVQSKMNAEQLRAIAIASGGAWVPAGTAAVDMGRVYAERIEPASKREFDATEVRRHTPRYQWFACLALVVLLVESFMSDRGPGRSEAS
jgi:Ca-activated chloride channel family protein